MIDTERAADQEPKPGSSRRARWIAITILFLLPVASMVVPNLIEYLRTPVLADCTATWGVDRPIDLEPGERFSIGIRPDPTSGDVALRSIEPVGPDDGLMLRFDATHRLPGGPLGGGPFSPLYPVERALFQRNNVGVVVVTVSADEPGTYSFDGFRMTLGSGFRSQTCLHDLALTFRVAG